MRFAERVAFYIAMASFLLAARATDVQSVSTAIIESFAIAAVLWFLIIGARWLISSLSGPKRS